MRNRIPALLVAALCLLVQGAATAAVIRAIDGRVEISRDGHTLEAKLGSRVREGDELQSDDKAEALIRFDDGGRLALRPGSRIAIRQLKLQGPPERRQATVRIIKGSLRYVTGRATLKRATSFETSKVTIGIRGTDLDIVVNDDTGGDRQVGTYVRVRSGAVTMTGTDGFTLDLDAGQAGFSGEPELTPRGSSVPRRAASRRLDGVPSNVFREGTVDRLMR